MGQYRYILKEMLVTVRLLLAARERHPHSKWPNQQRIQMFYPNRSPCRVAPGLVNSDSQESIKELVPSQFQSRMGSL